MPLGLLLTHPPQIPPFFWNRATTQQLHRPYRTTKCYKQQWPWRTPSGRPPAMSAASHLLISYTLLLYLTSKIVTPCWCMSVVYLSFFCFKRKDKRVKLCGKPEMSSFFFFFALQTLTSLLYFYLLEKSSWLFYIVMMLMMTTITYLLAVQGALLPVCAWKERWQYDRMEEDVMKIMISGVSVLLLLCWMFLSFLSMRDSWEMFVCVCACFWTLICSSQGSE